MQLALWICKASADSSHSRPVLFAGVVPALCVVFELVRVEINVAEVPGSVAFGLIVEVL